MKSIELTEDHKSKLLEMCKTLFPEYDFGLDKWQQPFVSLGLKTKDLYEEHIHWFEFCIIYLLPKFNFEPDLLLNSDLKNTHLIDYLYNEFKQLKL